MEPSFLGKLMAHKSRRQRNNFECRHKGFGKYCHFCKDLQAGKKVGIKIPKKGEKVDAATGKPEEPRYWNRAKCPFCGSSRVKKNDLNVLSALDAKEYTCGDFNCGKQFDSDQVKEYDKVEVKPRAPRQ